jgi:hypothetical protein
MRKWDAVAVVGALSLAALLCLRVAGQSTPASTSMPDAATKETRPSPFEEEMWVLPAKDLIGITLQCTAWAAAAPIITIAPASGVLVTRVMFAFVSHPFVKIMLWLAVNRNPGPFQRQQFEAIVAQVRRMHLRPGEEFEFQLDDFTHPESLRPLTKEEARRSLGEGRVWAALSHDGKLKVVIETRNLGHAGEYGFAYSDATLLPKPSGGDDGGCLVIDVPGPLNFVLPEMRIDDHWWKVEYNLD